MCAEQIIQVAKAVRQQMLDDGYDPDGGCYEYSATVARALRDHGLQAAVVEGRYETDSPYTKWRTLVEPCLPSHAWVEVGQRLLDITADQFNPYLRVPNPVIVFGCYAENPRYRPND